ncbi:MAG: hypothetical protein DMG22_09565 [Acidobacteria bacterium]|nr:MAG: hypothetical protein DMG22_09565 [Acidobacteriota bacterium]
MKINRRKFLKGVSTSTLAGALGKREGGTRGNELRPAKCSLQRVSATLTAAKGRAPSRCPWAESARTPSSLPATAAYTNDRWSITSITLPMSPTVSSRSRPIAEGGKGTARLDLGLSVRSNCWPRRH